MLLLALAAGVLVGSTAVVVQLLGPVRSTAAAMAAIIVATAQVQLAVLVSGSLGQLRPGPLLAVQGIVSVLAIWLAIVGTGADLAGLGRGRRSRAVAPVAAFAVGSGEVAAASVDGPRRTPIVVAVRAHPLHVALVASVVALHLWHVGLAVALPAVDYDGLALHATAVAHWVTTGSFAPSGISPMVDAAPLGPAAISAWTVTFTSSLSWMLLTPLTFLALGSLAVADLARRFGADAWDAVLAAAAFGGVPVVIVQATSGYPDLAAAGSVVAAWALWAAVADEDRSFDAGPDGAVDLVLVGLALGTAIGARPANLAAAGLLILAALVAPAIRAPAAGGPAGRLVVRRAALLVLPMLAVGGAWYLRDIVAHGNPLHPFRIGPFPGRGTVERLIVAPNRPDELTAVGGRVAQTVTSWLADLSPSSYSVDQRMGGLGPIFPLLLVPVSIVVVISERRTSVRMTFGLALALLAVVPTPWWSRGTLFLLAVAAAGLGAVASGLRGSRRRALLGAVLVLTVVGGAVVVRQSTYVSATSHRRMGPLAVLEAARRGDDHAVLPYDGYRTIDERWPDATIALVEGAIPSLRAPLFGSHLQREVIVLPATADPDALAVALTDAGADLVVVRTSARPLLEAVDADRGRGPLAVVATGSEAPSGTVVLAVRPAGG